MFCSFIVYGESDTETVVCTILNKAECADNFGSDYIRIKVMFQNGEQKTYDCDEKGLINGKRYRYA